MSRCRQSSAASWKPSKQRSCTAAGTVLLPADSPLAKGGVSMKPGLSCSSPMETQYLTCSLRLPPVRAQCGQQDELLPPPAELTDVHTVVLAICADCQAAGKQSHAAARRHLPAAAMQQQSARANPAAAAAEATFGQQQALGVCRQRGRRPPRPWPWPRPKPRLIAPAAQSRYSAPISSSTLHFLAQHSMQWLVRNLSTERKCPLPPLFFWPLTCPETKNLFGTALHPLVPKPLSPSAPAPRC